MDSLIILLKDDKILSSALVTHGHHVVVPKGTDSLNPSNPILLSRPNIEVFSEELEQMGFSPQESKRVSQQCNRSVTIFQRMHPSIDTHPPDWAIEEQALILIPAMLVGRWDASSKNDKEILCTIYGESEYLNIE